MSNAFQVTISILALLGVGGIAAGYITYVLDKKKERGFKVLEQKEKRYKSCLLYMDAFLEPKNIKYLSSRQPDIDDAKDVLEYLRMEFHEMILYSSKEVIVSVRNFIENPTQENFLSTILVMRKDLSKKDDLDLNKIKLNLLKKL
jgi:hypothetical protein